MRRHTIFRNYCRYYYRMTTVVTTVIVVTTVVTTVVTENRMPTHAIFFLMSDARCRETIFFKNRPSWTMTRRSAQCFPAQKRGEPSDNQRVFARICHRRRDSLNILGAHGVLSHRKNPLKPYVSRPREPVVMMVSGKCDCSY